MRRGTEGFPMFDKMPRMSAILSPHRQAMVREEALRLYMRHVNTAEETHAAAWASYVDATADKRHNPPAFTWGAP